jgi:hypothetical protein
MKELRKIGNEMCAVCNKLIRYLHKHHYSKMKKGEFISKRQTAKFFFYRGKLMAYLYTLERLKNIDENEKWRKVWTYNSDRFANYEFKARKYLDKMIKDNHF